MVDSIVVAAGTLLRSEALIETDVGADLTLDDGTSWSLNVA